MLKTFRAEAPTFLRFLIVGGTGFAVDALVLLALHNGLGIDPFSSRVVSIVAATFTTWRLNRVHTFAASRHSQAGEGFRYATVAALAAGVNYGVYASALLLWRGMPPMLALIAGSGTATAFSYLGYSRVVFSGPRAILGAPNSQRR